MTEGYVPPLADPAFKEFLKAEDAALLAWDNVKAARTHAARKIALENYEDIQYEARQARALCHKCVNAVKYEPSEIPNE